MNGHPWDRTRNRRWRAGAVFLALTMLVVRGAQPQPAPASDSDVRAVLERQVRQWNAGNLAGFMETYARSGNTRFASGGDVVRGWQTVFDRYQKKYGDRAAMGTLTLNDLEITLLGPQAAMVFGHWHLKRESDEPAGVFTLILRKLPEGWRIVHDHTSSSEKK